MGDEGRTHIRLHNIEDSLFPLLRSFIVRKREKSPCQKSALFFRYAPFSLRLSSLSNFPASACALSYMCALRGFRTISVPRLNSFDRKGVSLPRCLHFTSYAHVFPPNRIRTFTNRRTDFSPRREISRIFHIYSSFLIYCGFIGSNYLVSGALIYIYTYIRL